MIVKLNLYSAQRNLGLIALAVVLFLPGLPMAAADTPTRVAQNAAKQSAPSNSQTTAKANDDLAQALEAEFAAQDQRPEDAARLYLQAAEKSKRADYAENATRYAFNARNFILAEKAAKLWRGLVDNDLSSHQAVAFALIAQGKKDAALTEIRALMLRDKGAQYAVELMGAPDAKSIAVDLLGELRKEPKIIALAPERGLIPLALRLKQNELGLELATAKSVTDAKNSKAWLWRGLAEIANDQTDAAATSYRQALALDPNNSRLRLSYVQILNDLKRIAEIDDVLRAAPVADQAIFQARMAYFTSAKNKPGIKRLMKEIEKSATLNLSDKQMLMGSAGELLEKPKLALQWYQAIGKGEHWPNAQLRIAVLQSKNNLDLARETLHVLQESVAADQAIIDGYLLEAELLNAAKRQADAKTVLSAGLQQHPEATDLLYSRAMTALQLKDINTMESDLLLMAQLNPENAEAWNALGYSLLVETDRTEEAYGYIQQAYALEPDSGAIQDSLGWAMFKRGRLDQAVPMLRTAYQSAPEGEVAAHLGEALWELGAKQEALDVFREASAKFPDSEPLQETIKRLAIPLKDARKP